MSTFALRKAAIHPHAGHQTNGYRLRRHFLVNLGYLAVDVRHDHCGSRPYWHHLCIEEGLSDMAMVVVVEEDGAGARVALKGIHTPIAAVPHEVKAKLSRCACLLAEALHPLPDLQSPQTASGSHKHPQSSGRVNILQRKWGPWGTCACCCCSNEVTVTLPLMCLSLAEPFTLSRICHGQILLYNDRRVYNGLAPKGPGPKVDLISTACPAHHADGAQCACEGLVQFC